MILERFELVDMLNHVSDDLLQGEFLAKVPSKSPIFDGHFDDYPILPGVLSIEMIAQAAGFLILAYEKIELMPFLMGVDQARFKGFIEPGETLTVNATLEHRGSGYWAAAGYVSRNSKKLTQAKLRLAIKDFPTPKMRQHIEDRMSELGVSSVADRVQEEVR